MNRPLSAEGFEAQASSRAQNSALLNIRSVAKSFGKHAVLHNISLDVAEGEFLTILGESGSGKTTLMRIIGGFEHATSGEVWLGREALDLRPPSKLSVNQGFQNDGFFPHRSVVE